MLDEKDMLLLGIISCVTDNSETTHRSKKAPDDMHVRQRQRSYYMKNGKKVCRDTFMFMYRLVCTVYNDFYRVQIQLNHCAYWW